MTFDLYRDDGEPREFHVNNHTWGFLLATAEEAGWQPAGTQPNPDWEPSERTWSGTYGLNDGQIVTAEDAAAIVAALDTLAPLYTSEAEADIALKDAQFQEMKAFLAHHRERAQLVTAGERERSSDEFANEMKRMFRRHRENLSPAREERAAELVVVRNFREFCRGGAFKIH